MRFRIQDSVFERFPTYCIGLVVARGVQNGDRSDHIAATLQRAEVEARERLFGRDLDQSVALSHWRAAFRSLGMSPARYRTSVEALIARVLRGDALPRVSPVVDMINAVSLNRMVPIGGHDCAQLAGDLVVGPLSESTPFTPMAGDSEIVAPGEYVYADDREVRTRRWVWRQSAATRVTATSRDIVFPIDGWLGISDDAVRAAQADLALLLQQECAAEAELFFLDRERRTVQVDAARAPVDAPVSGADGFRMSGLGYREQPSQRPNGDSKREARALESGTDHGWRAVDDEITDVLNRGTVDVVIREALEARMRAGDRLRVKFGVDPTGPQLHLGHAVQLRKLRAFQRLGHTICLVVGDFTAQIGDASDRNAMRQMLTEEHVYTNMSTYRKQIARVLDVDSVEWSYNNDWLGPLRFKDVIGLSAHFTVAQMMERENFTMRYTSGKPIGLQEFLYPLMQGYDSVALKADVEIGGTEQLFNLMAGRTLQQAFGQRSQAVITCALLLGTDGAKMSKTANNCIYIGDPPKDMYGKVMSLPDAQIVPYFEMCTDLPVSDLRAIADQLHAGLNPMLLKKRLAHEITRLYHGAALAQRAEETFEREVQRKELPDEIEQRTLTAEQIQSLPDLLVHLGLVKSKSEARRLAEQGGVRVDGAEIRDAAAPIALRDEMLVQVGKRNRVRVRLAP